MSRNSMSSILRQGGTWPLRLSDQHNSTESDDLWYKMPHYLEIILQELHLVAESAKIYPSDSGTISFIQTKQKNIVVKIDRRLDNIKRNKFFYDCAASNQIPIPNIISCDSSLIHIQYGYIVMEYIDWINIRYESVDNRKVAATQLGKELGLLHSIPVPNFGSSTTGGRWTANDWSSVLLHEFLDKPYIKHASKLFTSSEIKTIQTARFSTIDFDLKPCLIHGDLTYSNILYRKEEDLIKLAGFIDPGDLVAGDYLIDLVNLHNNVIYEHLTSKPHIDTTFSLMRLTSLGISIPIRASSQFLFYVFRTYNQINPFTLDDENRFIRLGLLHAFSTSCWQYENDIDPIAMKDVTAAWIINYRSIQ